MVRAALGSAVHCTCPSTPHAACHALPLPAECKAKSDCHSIDCAFDILHQDIHVDVDFNVRGSPGPCAAATAAQLPCCRAPSQVCSNPVSLTLSVADESHHLHWSHTFSASESVYVPGLSIDVPHLGSAGVKVGVEVGGAKHELDVSITLTACVHVGGEEVPVAHRALRAAVPDAGELAPATEAGDLGFDKCFPNPPLRVVKFHALNFSWVTCRAEDAPLALPESDV